MALNPVSNESLSSLSSTSSDSSLDRAIESAKPYAPSKGDAAPAPNPKPTRPSSYTIHKIKLAKWEAEGRKRLKENRKAFINKVLLDGLE